MGNLMQSFRGRIRNYRHSRIWRDERGSATVEFVMMVPVFMALMFLIADASMVYNKQAMLMDISRDTARIVSRYALTAEEAQTHAVKAAGTSASPATAHVSIIDGFVTVTVATDAATAAPFGFIKFAISDKISATATVVMEPV
ncbi:MAG: TadE/TadG family type IV pilus assembly protein [Pseudotabrizicola sp.]|uniref:TadE/TadG family type IV pilus assembly protein n=1 Tax=Pseudotabrizicola sp. TaxID=2939647 RepID=UPI0027310221|nr:TadE/TadG family type IV pilus assembly protein [Pseudotabrizicola sp.]MDP2081634.1 pilus assembly protein [Pseudotabrizicola sp.]MDZ7575059.1 TadE/TadG family type IV pilus assembly protein [Pseudotabrizicola sp.]